MNGAPSAPTPPDQPPAGHGPGPHADPWHARGGATPGVGPHRRPLPPGAGGTLPASATDGNAVQGIAVAFALTLTLGITIAVLIGLLR